MPRRPLPILTLLALAAAVPALDLEDLGAIHEPLPFVDIRFGVGVMPIPEQYDVRVTLNPPNPPGAANWSDHFKDDSIPTYSYTLIGGWTDPVGPLFGAEIVYARTQRTLDHRVMGGATLYPANDMPQQRWNSLGGNAIGGIGIALTPRWRVELLGVAGLGSVRTEMANWPMDATNSGTGWYWDAGLRAGLYYTRGHFVIGGFVDATYSEYTINATWSDGATRVDREDAFGVGGRIEFGYHID